MLKFDFLPSTVPVGFEGPGSSDNIDVDSDDAVLTDLSGGNNPALGGEGGDEAMGDECESGSYAAVVGSCPTYTSCVAGRKYEQKCADGLHWVQERYVRN